MWFQDEARIGQKNSLTRVWGQTGSRPVAPKDLGFASAYVFGAVCPSAGKAAALIMPICNTAAMNHHLCEISSQVAADAHAVVILDGAGWHRSQGLVVPGNITLLELPPYSPELNPVERIWHYLRSHWLANSVFISLADIMDACETAWNRFAADHALIRSLCAVGWAPASSAPVLLGAAPAVFNREVGQAIPSWHHKKSGAEHSIQRHSSSPTGLSGGCAKPIFDHAHERSAKRQGERGLILCPLSSNLPYRARRVELRLQQRRKTEEAGFELSVPRSMCTSGGWQRSASAEWDDILRDLDRLQEIELEQDGKRFLLRTPTTGVAGKLFQAVGVALPPNLQELPRTTPQPAA